MYCTIRSHDDLCNLSEIFVQSIPSIPPPTFNIDGLFFSRRVDTYVSRGWVCAITVEPKLSFRVSHGRMDMRLASGDGGCKADA
jgi:hypothetical protein